MKENKPKDPLLGFITGGGTYKEDEFEEDAAKVVEYYQNSGYPQARVGQPEIKTLEDTKDGKTRWIQLRIPVTEGERYRLGDLNFEGNKVVRGRRTALALQVEAGRVVQPQEAAATATRRRRRCTAARGYMEWTPFPMLQVQRRSRTTPRQTLAALVPPALAAPAATRRRAKGSRVKAARRST